MAASLCTFSTTREYTGLHYMEHNDSQKRMIIGWTKGFSSLTHCACVHICAHMCTFGGVFWLSFVEDNSKKSKGCNLAISEKSFVYCTARNNVFEPHKDYHQPLKGNLFWKNITDQKYKVCEGKGTWWQKSSRHAGLQTVMTWTRKLMCNQSTS